MHASVNWLRSRDVSIRVDETRLGLLFASLLHGGTLIHDHGVGASTSRDDHSSKGTSSLNTFIVHDVLGVVLLYSLAIRILKAVGLHYSRLSGEIVSAGLLSVVSQHFIVTVVLYKGVLITNYIIFKLFGS